MLEKYGDSEVYITRENNDTLWMTIPGSHEQVLYDGRFGVLPLTFTKGYFPYEETSNAN